MENFLQIKKQCWAITVCPNTKQWSPYKWFGQLLPKSCGKQTNKSQGWFTHIHRASCGSIRKFCVYCDSYPLFPLCFSLIILMQLQNCKTTQGEQLSADYRSRLPSLQGHKQFVSKKNKKHTPKRQRRRECTLSFQSHNITRSAHTTAILVHCLVTSCLD